MGLNMAAVYISQETYRRVASQARKAGKAPDDWTREVIEAALQMREPIRPRTTPEVLRSAGRVRPLSDALRRRIIPGVTLDEVREALSEAPGPSLSEIIAEQRGATL